MQTTASAPTNQFSDLLNRLLAGLDLDRLALETKAIQRKRKIGDGASLLRLALARGPGGFSLRQASAWVFAAGDRRSQQSRRSLSIEAGGGLPGRSGRTPA